MNFCGMQRYGELEGSKYAIHTWADKMKRRRQMKRLFWWFVTALLALMILMAYGIGYRDGYRDGIEETTPQEIYVQVGIASWYGPGFHGRRAADGSIYNQNELTAAHRYLPFGTRLRVTNLRNGLSVMVTITDRGPFVGERIIDLSRAAAAMIDMVNAGLSRVTLKVVTTPVRGHLCTEARTSFPGRLIGRTAGFEPVNGSSNLPQGTKEYNVAVRFGKGSVSSSPPRAVPHLPYGLALPA